MSKYFNLHISSIRLMSSYLASRYQRVKVNGTISNTLPVNTGVPQGSILGPFMFIMFINDLTEECTCYLFADDCIIEQNGETPELAVKKTNNTLPAVIRWYSNNLIKNNASKTQLTPVNQGGIAKFTNTMKYLGLYIDSSPSRKYHINMTKNKVMPIVWALAKISHLIDEQTARMYYVSIIRPHLEYAAAVLFIMSGQCSTVLETL